MSSTLLEFQQLERVESLDSVIFQHDDVFHLNPAAIEDMQRGFLSESFRWHFEKNDGYRNYCIRLGADPQRIIESGDLCAIPLIPSSQFKISDIVSGNREDVIKICQSSGTLGSISKVCRDETTLGRFLGALRCTIEQVMDVDDAFCLHLGPTRQEAGDLWFSYVMSVTDLLYPTEHFVRQDVFDPAALLRRFREVRNRHETTVLIGAPIMFLRLLDYMRDQELLIDDCQNLLVITAGGWKRYSGSMIARDSFTALLQKHFRGLPAASCRDFFNMVELNAVFVECKHWVKHIPPWIRVVTLDPETLKPLSVGEIGLLGYLDPTPTSYPGFVLTDDFGKVSLDGACQCGRSGQAIEIIRRVNRVESRGCALKIDRNYDGERTHRYEE